ncbi:MAG: coiled-coil domain-containing protein [Promethearchaeota archaeon]
MENFTDKKLDFTSAAIEEQNGKFYFIGEALTQDYECEDGLKVLAEKIINKHFTWRHRHPIQKEHKENHVYGIIENAWVKDKLMVKTRLYDHTKDHLKLIQDIQLRDLVNDPLSLSMHYRTYFNEKGDVKHYDVFELAGTPYPHCKECNILNGVLKLEKNEEEIENKEEEAKLEDEAQKTLKVIKDLEDELNSKTEAYEELSSKVSKLESELEIKNKELEDKNTKEKTLDDRVLELESKINFLETKKPILDKLLEADSEIDENQANWLKEQDVSYIEKRLEKAIKKAESQIVVSEIKETVDEAKLELEKEEKKLEKVTFDHFIRDVGPVNKGSRVK